MARIGLIKPRVAKYAESSGTVSYSSGKIIAKAITHELTLDNADPVVLYADDGAAESMGGFSSGSLTIGIDELPLDVAGLLFGITPATSSDPAGSILSFDDSAEPPYLGYGVIVPKVTGGTRSYMAVLLTKIKFVLPPDSFETRGETVTFKTPELTAKVLRDDSTNHTWRKWAEFETETAASSWLNSQLSIT